MFSNQYINMEEPIDTDQMMWEPQEPYGQAGAWAEELNGGLLIPQDTAFAASITLEDEIVAYQPGPLNPAEWPSFQTGSGGLYPYGDNILGVLQPTTFEQDPFFTPPPLRPQAENSIPNVTRRPQLQLHTDDINLQPGLPAYNEPLPRSAPPDIRVVGPDALPMPHPMSAMPIRDSSRRRARTNPHREPPSFRHSTTEPETHLPLANDLLSPVMSDWVEAEDAVPQAFIAQTSFNATDRSPTRNRRGSASPSRSRSQSRSGSRAGSRRGSTASSNRSSMNGDFECHHRDCGKRYTTMAKLNHHKRYHTPDHERPNCGARFLFKRELDRHKQSITHAGRHFFCTRCTAGFARADHLSRHIIKSSCSERAVTPSPTSVVHSTPSSNGSSVAQNLRHRVSTGDLRSGTPNTDFSSSFPYGGNAFPLLPTQPTAFTDIDCDDYLDLNANQWPPSPTPGTNDYFQFDSIPSFAAAQW
ncbi:hypothetical protein LTR10_002677 [Elasticomyces elasticus]|nr:hypothetical protein LTR10_002677 [Elasticomyces elasticus]